MHKSHYSRLEKPTIPLAAQERLPRIYCTQYLSLRIRTSGASQLEKRNNENKVKRKGKIKKRKTKTKKETKEKKRQEKQGTTKQEKEARKRKEKKCHTSRPLELTKDGIGLIEGIKCIINDTGERTQHREEIRAVLRYFVTAIGRPTKFKRMMARPRLQSLGQDLIMRVNVRTTTTTRDRNITHSLQIYII